MRKNIFKISLLTGALLLYFHITAYSQGKITVDSTSIYRMKTIIEYLASESMMGRESGTAYEIKARDYIIKKFSDAEIMPFIGDTSYIHSFTFNQRLLSTTNNYLKINKKEYKLDADFYPLSISGTTSAKGKAITATIDGNYNIVYQIPSDSNKIKDNILVIDIAKQGQEKTSRSKAVIHRYQLIEVASRTGAKGIILINTQPNLMPNPTGRISKTDSCYSIPIIFAQQKALKTLLDATTCEIEFSVSIQNETLNSYNVVGIIDNKAPLSIIIGAHYDHLGYHYDYTDDFHINKEIYNGADDNATGVAAIIELAKSKKLSDKFNYLFIAFGAEEKGLLGSSAFVNSEHFQRLNYQCMLNFDMVGRIDTATHKLSLIGTGTSSWWDSLIKITYSDYLNIKTSPSGIGGSDHTSFYLKGLPVLFYFGSMHTDYHQTTDDVEKINYTGQYHVIHFTHTLTKNMENIGKMDYVKTDRGDKNSSRSRGPGLGIMPDHAYEGKGIKIAAVTKDKPADKAQLMEGDIIIEIGSTQITDIQTYMNVLSKIKKGEETKIKVLRSNTTIETLITL